MLVAAGVVAISVAVLSCAVFGSVTVVVVGNNGAGSLLAVGAVVCVGSGESNPPGTLCSSCGGVLGAVSVSSKACRTAFSSFGSSPVGCSSMYCSHAR